jgi:hypothetical protein
MIRAMSGLEAASPVPIATAIVAEIASPAMWLLGRRTAALLDCDTVPTVIESAGRAALDNTAAAYSEIVGVLLDTHLLARPPARRPAWACLGLVAPSAQRSRRTRKRAKFAVLIRRRMRFWRQRRRWSSGYGTAFANIRR